MEIVKVQNLKVWFPQKAGIFQKTVSHVKAVDDVSFSIPQGTIFSVVGESGSGKSTLGNAILGLTSTHSGSIFLKDQEYFTNGQSLSLENRRNFQMIYQDSHSSLNPRKTIFETLSQPLVYHGLCSKGESRDMVASLLESVYLEPDMMNRFPFAFSGGQRQRINIARTIGLNPEFIVCDEIVSALDVSIQAQILELIQELQQKLNLTLMFIGHDLAVVKNISDLIMVMNEGKIEEIGDVGTIFNNPQTDYTKELLNAVPSLDLTKRKR